MSHIRLFFFFFLDSIIRQSGPVVKLKKGIRPTTGKERPRPAGPMDWRRIVSDRAAW